MKRRTKTFIKSLALVLAAIALFMGILKLDGVCMREWEFSIVPFAIIGVILALGCVVLAFKAQSQAIKLSFAYLSILPLCLACGEVFFWYKTTSAVTVQPNKIIGTTNKPLVKSFARFTVDEQLIYDVMYEHDEYGLRITPHANTESKTCLNVYGGSFVYGAGLNNDETLPAYLSANLANVQVRNFGIGSAGAAQMLARLEFDMDSAVLKDCDENLFIYVAIPHHLYRALGANRGPKYTLDLQGMPVYHGKFGIEYWNAFHQDLANRQFGIAQRFTNQLEKSYIKQFLESAASKNNSTEEMFRYFPNGYYSNSYLPNINENSFEIYFAIVKQIQKTLQDKYNATLHVIFWDYDMHAQFLDRYDSLIESSFKRDQIPYTKVSEILGEPYKQDLARVKQGDFDHLTYRISRWDTHPNALANQKIAEYIAREIIQGNLTFAKSPVKPPHKEQK